jgi:hypothetical protein
MLQCLCYDREAVLVAACEILLIQYFILYAFYYEQDITCPFDHQVLTLHHTACQQ